MDQIMTLLLLNLDVEMYVSSPRLSPFLWVLYRCSYKPILEKPNLS